MAQNPRLGWHFNFWLIFIFSVVTLILGYFVTPETVSYHTPLIPINIFSVLQYGPVLLRRRAEKLHTASGGIIHYVSTHDLHQSRSFCRVMCINLSRPFCMSILVTNNLLELTMLCSVYHHRAHRVSSCNIHFHRVRHALCPLRWLPDHLPTTSRLYARAMWTRVPRNRVWHRHRDCYAILPKYALLESNG